MILREATIKYKGYDPEDLTLQSNKRICMACDNCGRVRWCKFYSYRDLCNSCSHKGIEFTDEHKQNIRKVHIGMKSSLESRIKQSKSISGRKNHNYGKPRSDKAKENIRLGSIGRIISQHTRYLMSCAKQGIEIKDFIGFVGRHSKRSYVLSEEQCLKMNDRFFGSHTHHIIKSIIIYIPSELHNHIKHNIKTGYNMGEINMVALQYINGCYSE